MTRRTSATHRTISGFPVCSTRTRFWNGRPASPGIVAGRAHVVRTDADVDTFEPGSILVARHGTPDLYPAVARALATVCETGGILCHLAVLSRELARPCVTGAAGAVDGIQTGNSLRVDGGRGIVELLGGGLDAHPEAPLPGLPAPHTMVALAQFGRFSADFRCVEARLDLTTAIGIAAMLTVPVAFGIGPAWEFGIDRNRVLVDARALDTATSTMVDRLEAGTIDAEAVGARWGALCRSGIWSAVAAGAASTATLHEALHHYVELSQLTWGAVITREPLARRYRTFLCEALPGEPFHRGEELYLDSLVLPARSFIPRAWEDRHAGRAAPASDAAALRSDADGRRRQALAELERKLSPAGTARMHRYLETLDHLVDLAERKNTDVVRCREALFGTEANRHAATRLLGTWADEVSPGDPQVGPHVLTELVRRICNGTL